MSSKKPKEESPEIKGEGGKEEGVEEEETKKLYAGEIKLSTKDLIDKLKPQINIENEGDRKPKISDVIDQSVFILNEYNSLTSESREIMEKYKEEYGSEFGVIDEALLALDKQKNPDREDDLDLWCRAREEMSMMLIGETTFKAFLLAADTPESLDMPMKRNIALDTITWYKGELIRDLSLEDILGAIKKFWTVANYFYFIDIKKEQEDEYFIILKHHQNKRYSSYWLGYFKELFNSPDLSFRALAEGEAFDETLSMKIKKLYDNKMEEVDVI